MVAPITDRLPLIIGIAGHRDLHEQDAESLKALEDQVTSIIAKLESDYLGGGTAEAVGKTPVILLSSLVGKARQIAAGAAQAIGARLVSPFGADSPELAETLLKADSQQDHAACLFIARYCHVLIAIWDGDAGDQSVGAPTQIVDLRRKGLPLHTAHSVRACLDGAEIGPVIDVKLAKTRKGGSAPDIRVPPWGLDFMAPHEASRLQKAWRAVHGFARHLLGRQVKPARADLSDEEKQTFESWQSFAALIGLTKEFNIDASGLAFASDGTYATTESIEWLFGVDTGNPLGKEALESATKLVPRWCHNYAVADTLAQRWQKKFWQDWFRLFALALGAIASFEVFAHLAYWLPHAFPPLRAVGIDIFLLLLYAGALVGIFWVYRTANRRRHQERFLDYRALAEALRVAIFWQLMGVGEAAPGGNVSVADAYPIKQPSELAWVKTGLWGLEFLDYAEQPGASRTIRPQAAFYWLRDLWVRGQSAYFTKKAHDNDELAAIHEDRSYALLVASIAIALGLIFLKHVVSGMQHHEWPHDVVIFCIGILPGVAAAILGYSEKLAYKAQARQYDRMRGVFGQALAHLKIAPTPETYQRIQELFYHLGVEAMREHAEWVAIYRQRPIQPP